MLMKTRFFQRKKSPKKFILPNPIQLQEANKSFMIKNKCGVIHHATFLKFMKMEKLSSVIVILIKKCLKENLKGIIEFTKDDFSDIGFNSSQPLAEIVDDETKIVANSYGFDYDAIRSNPEILVFINRIEDVSECNSHKYKFYYYENNNVKVEIYDTSTGNLALNKSICSVMQNREKLLRE